ncbi:unnamed protein product [Onchocerca flexuosa]|uniref:Uncharacterized protein n=1 Tax=Onchocerca flexuosa TaxID=387005 RepID=A0A183HE84_9BILA|nr:unnamed protein product [Onchocerca flexuosa]
MSMISIRIVLCNGSTFEQITNGNGNFSDVYYLDNIVGPEKDSLQDLGNDDLFGDLAGMDPIVLSNVDELTSSFESIELRNMESNRMNTNEQPTSE